MYRDVAEIAQAFLTRVLDSRGSGNYNHGARAGRVFSGRPASAQVAQLVEHCTENAGVGGSIPPLGTTSEIFFKISSA